MSILNIASNLDWAARQTPDRVFIYSGETRLTFGQIEAQACRFANVLASLRVTSGQHVALLLPNDPMFAICYFGALKLGAVVMPLNATAPGPEVGHYLNDGHAAVLVAHELFLEAAQVGMGAAPECLHLLVVNLPDSDNCPPRAARLYPLMEAQNEQFPTHPTRNDDTASILYTSGTTGGPKGVRLTHFNMLCASHAWGHHGFDMSHEDVILLLAPVSHAIGHLTLHLAVFAQIGLSLMPRFEPGVFLTTMERDTVTTFLCVPSIVQMLLNTPPAHSSALTSLRRILVGGTALPTPLALAFSERFGVEVFHIYAATETHAVAFGNTALIPAGSVGKPAWGVDLRIMDEQGHEMPAGDKGEIEVRGPQVFPGYHSDAGADPTVWRGDWFRTGDIGYLDDDGNLFLVDRLKHIIKAGGYTVYPSEVEAILHVHPAVAMSAVVGKPHATLGEVVTAFVVLKAEMAVTASELIKFCKDRLSAYKCPRRIRFRESLPLNRAGKVERKELSAD